MFCKHPGGPYAFEVGKEDEYCALGGLAGMFEYDDGPAVGGMAAENGGAAAAEAGLPSPIPTDICLGTIGGRFCRLGV